MGAHRNFSREGHWLRGMTSCGMEVELSATVKGLGDEVASEAERLKFVRL